MLSISLSRLHCKTTSSIASRRTFSSISHRHRKPPRPLIHSSPLTISKAPLNRVVAVPKISSSPTITLRFCASSAPEVTPKPRFSLFQWKDATIARLKAKKAQVLVEYGSTFIFLHEFLGIASYATCFAIASSGFVTMDDIISFIGVIPDNIQEMIASKRDSVATTALTALVLLKCLDWLGLTPFRWFLAITLTPRIAWWLGPRIDRVVDSIKSKLPKRKAAIPPVSEVVQPIPTADQVVSTNDKSASL